MADRYAEIEPYDTGMLDVGDGYRHLLGDLREPGRSGRSLS
jgi:hypothetical protein